MPTAEPRLDPKTRRLVIIGMLFNIVLLAGAWYFLIGRPSQQQPAAAPSAIGGPFSMTDQVGRTVTDATLRGKPFALFFGFTRCPDVCPTTLNRLAKLRKTLGLAAFFSALPFFPSKY